MDQEITIQSIYSNRVYKINVHILLHPSFHCSILFANYNIKKLPTQALWIQFIILHSCNLAFNLTLKLSKHDDV